MESFVINFAKTARDADTTEVGRMHFCRGRIRAFRNSHEQKQVHGYRCGTRLDLTDRDGEPVIWEYMCEYLAVIKGLIW